jgi:hypothetical protein
VTGPYGPEHVNAAQARRDPESLYHHLRRLIHAYRCSPEIGWGDLEILDHADAGCSAGPAGRSGGEAAAAVLAHRLSWGGAGHDPADRGGGVPLSVVMLHNLSADAQSVRLDLTGERWPVERISGWALRDLMGGEDLVIGPDGTAEVVLEGYGYRWLRTGHPQDHRLI